MVHIQVPILSYNWVVPLEEVFACQSLILHHMSTESLYFAVSGKPSKLMNLQGRVYSNNDRKGMTPRSMGAQSVFSIFSPSMFFENSCQQ